MAASNRSLKNMGVTLVSTAKSRASRHAGGTALYRLKLTTVNLTNVGEKINNNTKSDVTVGTEGNMNAFLNAIMPSTLAQAA